MNAAFTNVTNLLRDRSNPQSLKSEAEDDRIDQELENILNRQAPSYNEIDYWNTRYEREPEPFDWYQTWGRLRPIVLPAVSGRQNALDIGCGNSTLAADLLEDGFEHVVGYDASSVVIEQNKQRYGNESRLEWICGDVTKMEKIESNKFDFVIDKGTIDSLMCAGSSARSVTQILAEVARVLKPGGVFVEVSYGTPNTRTSFLKNPQFGWNLLENQEIEKITEKDTYHYIYFAQKNSGD
ncbi:Menaquinone biosynthesis methyltransferase [Tritrichomonas foetus]|uniref:Menaquinone biosynthesis methyltransferase n=1 Tax=Tritrichomonas foetus TaxID=1144522 RepID=A0A1J4KJM3_9EUKA|nr:Menaquinone biosynthesis methyltransferase [Tritrichomonas foetus]|eukprot:OHT11419.1 Menaquinone biosynthesis methyltransferase [Tritrichomonas foetus]